MTPPEDRDAGREPIEDDVEEAYEESGYSPERASRRAEDAGENAERSGLSAAGVRFANGGREV